MEARPLVDDVLTLDDYSEDALLNAISDRFDSQLFYTFAGSILIALNPYAWREEMYSPEVRSQRARPSHARQFRLQQLSCSHTDRARLARLHGRRWHRTPSSLSGH